MNYLTFTAILTAICTVQAQELVATAIPSTNEGSEFYMAFLKNYEGGGSKIDHLQLIITSQSSSVSSVTISTIEGVLSNTTVTSSSPAIVNVPVSLMVKNVKQSERRKGLHIAANSSDIAVVAVNMNMVNNKGSATTAAYNIIPHQRLPVQKYEYFAVSVGTIVSELVSEVLLVSTENDTTIEIYPSQEVHLPRDPQGDNSNVKVRPGSNRRMTLHRLQTLLITCKGKDLTGTRIVSNKPLSVLSGHECGNVPTNMGGCDHIGAHLPPTASWGKEFALVPFLDRPAGQQFKIISAQEDTKVECTCSGAVLQPVNLPTPGKVYEFHTSSFSSCYLKSNRPLLVVQLGMGNDTDGMGDPAMMVLPPIDKYTNKVSFVPLGNSFSFSHNFINILTTSEHFEYTNILLDGQPVQADWTMVVGNNKTRTTFGCKLSVTPGPHTVEHTHPNGRLSVLVYGFDKNPRHGYGFEAGSGSRRISYVPVVTVVSEPQTVVNEGDEITIQLQRTQDTSTDTLVDLALVEYSQGNTVSEIQVHFAPGEAKKTASFTLPDDTVHDETRHFTVHLIPTSNILLEGLTEVHITALDNDAVTIGFNEVSSDLPNLISGVEIVQGKLKEGMSLAVTLKAKNLGKGMFNGHVKSSQWNSRQLTFTSQQTHYRVDLSAWLQSQPTEDDQFVLITLSQANPSDLVNLEPNTLIANLRTNSTTIISSEANDDDSPIHPQAVVVTTMYMPCPQQTNQVILPTNSGIDTLEASSVQSIAIGVVFTCLLLLALSIIIPVIVCVIYTQRRKTGFYDVEARQS